MEIILTTLTTIGDSLKFENVILMHLPFPINVPKEDLRLPQKSKDYYNFKSYLQLISYNISHKNVRIYYFSAFPFRIYFIFKAIFRFILLKIFFFKFFTSELRQKICDFRQFLTTETEYIKRLIQEFLIANHIIRGCKY